MIINRVLDIAQQRQVLPSLPQDLLDGNSKTTSDGSTSSYIIKEFIETERKYVLDLENLLDLQETLRKGAIPGDIVHSIFLNVRSILEFQHRFLAHIEERKSMPETEQRWGTLFVEQKDVFLTTYQPFLANQTEGGRLAYDFFNKIQSFQHPVGCDYTTLAGFLIKPFQRLVKYPMLLRELMRNTKIAGIKQDLAAGITAAEEVLTEANNSVEQKLVEEALERLLFHLDSPETQWIESLGRPLLYDRHTVISGRTGQEKTFEVYLFQHELTFWEAGTPKQRNMRFQNPKVGEKTARLQLKGRTTARVPNVQSSRF